MNQQTSYIDNLGRRIEALRVKEGLSLRELARRADLSVSFLSKVVKGTSIPTVMTLQKLCYALNIDMLEFLSESTEKEKRYLYKREDMKLVQGDGRQWYFTFPPGRHFGVIQTYEEYAPQTKILEKQKHPNDIFGFVISGELSIKFENESIRVKAGDAFYIPAYHEHVSSNPTDVTLQMIVGRIKYNSEQYEE